MMNSRKFYFLMLMTLLIAALSLGVGFAQESTETPESTSEAESPTSATSDMVTCDSDLILSWYIAQRFFGFDSFNSQLSTDMMVNLDTIDRGQFGTLFDEMDMSHSAMDASDGAHTDMMDMMGMSDADFDAQFGTMGDGSATNLSTGMMDEAEECAALRRALRRFYSAIAMSDIEMSHSDNEMGDSGTGSSTTDTETGSTGSSTDTEQAGVITVNLTGAEEVPGPGDEDGSGTATVYLRSESNEVCVDISVQNIALPSTAAHIHQAVAGEAGPPVVPLTAPNEAGVSNTCTTVDAALMQEMVNNPQNFYVNVHTSEFPDGAVRGQMQ